MQSKHELSYPFVSWSVKINLDSTFKNEDFQCNIIFPSRFDLNFSLRCENAELKNECPSKRFKYFLWFGAMHVAFEQQYLADVVAVGITSSRTTQSDAHHWEVEWNDWKPSKRTSTSSLGLWLQIVTIFNLVCTANGCFFFVWVWNGTGLAL